MAADNAHNGSATPRAADSAHDRPAGTTHDQAAGSARDQIAAEFSQLADRLGRHDPNVDEAENVSAANARFITPQDPVIVTSDGSRLPGVPLEEAYRLNSLKDQLDNEPTEEGDQNSSRAPQVGSVTRANVQESPRSSLQRTTPPSHTNPLFPPLPLYGPSSLLRDIQCTTFRVSSFFLSTGFLGIIVLGSLFTAIPGFLHRSWMRLTFRNPDAQRPFYEEEVRRSKARRELERLWKRKKSQATISPDKEAAPESDGYEPTEGGPDPIICDVGYYARRVGLDMEEFKVQTEDGFIIDLWHIYDPKEYTRLSDDERAVRGPDLFTGGSRKRLKDTDAKRKFPVLLLHGLLQSSGAYTVNDDDSLAFYLCKSGYDVWLGNNRCGFTPKHALLETTDPRMWSWNIRQMGVLDLPALTSRVLYETGFEKLGLICHSQGTTQTFVALAKEQRPELGEKLTVFCALAPAAYAGPLIDRAQFKIMRIISPGMFRVMFGIHAFIPLMMTMHRLVHPKVYGYLGYKIFSFLFSWNDARWDRELKHRMFQFAPVYVSAESMRWWLGRECFAKHKCILSTKEELHAEDREDSQTDGPLARPGELQESGLLDRLQNRFRRVKHDQPPPQHHHKRHPKGSTAWYNEQVPPFALWVAGNDSLVDGEKLLRRFENGREPYVQVVHKKVIPEYEHLDVLWAMDAVDQVFCEVRETLWKTCNVRDQCRVPKGCEGVLAWQPKAMASSVWDGDQSSSDVASL